MADAATLTEQKRFQGPAGLYGIPWKESMEYVSWLSGFDPSHHPVRTGHPIVFQRPVRYIPQSPSEMHVSNSRYVFPSGLQYSQWGFTGTMSSAPKLQAASPGFIPGPSFGERPGISQIHL